MDVISVFNFVKDNFGDVATGVGWVTSFFGVTLPLLKPSATKTFGVGVGKIAKAFLQQRTQHYSRAKRYASTLEQFAEGLLEGLK